MEETNDNDIDRHELCRRQKAISISLRGEVPPYLPFNPRNKLDEIAFSFRERRRHDKGAFEFLQIPRRRFHLRDMREGGLDRVLLRLASRVGGSGAAGMLRAFLLER